MKKRILGIIGVLWGCGILFQPPKAGKDVAYLTGQMIAKVCALGLLYFGIRAIYRSFKPAEPPDTEK